MVVFFGCLHMCFFEWLTVIQMFCPDVGVIQCCDATKAQEREFSPLHPHQSELLTFLSPPSQSCFLSPLWSSLSLQRTLFLFLNSACYRVSQIMLYVIYICHFVFLLATWRSIVKFGQVSISECEVRPDVDFDLGTGFVSSSSCYNFILRCCSTY